MSKEISLEQQSKHTEISSLVLSLCLDFLVVSLNILVALLPSPITNVGKHYLVVNGHPSILLE